MPFTVEPFDEPDNIYTQELVNDFNFFFGPYAFLFVLIVPRDNGLYEGQLDRQL